MTARQPVNPDLARLLDDIGAMMELLGEDSFRASAHTRAARTIRDLPFDLSTLDGEGDSLKPRLLELENIGPKIADKIVEFIGTGKIEEHDRLCKDCPPGLMELLRIPGLGPKTVRSLWQDGGVVNRASLQKIIDDGSILKLPRMGAKSVEKIKASLAFTATEQVRLWLGAALPLGEGIVKVLEKARAAARLSYAGSLRRGKETIGDIDILAAVEKDSPARAAALMEAFRGLPGVSEVLAAGETKSSIRLKSAGELARIGDGRKGRDVSLGAGIQIDLRIVPAASWGAALLYFTGSKEHNVELRERAQKMGLTLNEYGLFPEDDEETPPQARGIRPVAAATEEEVYAALGLAYIPPELREARGEIERFELAGAEAVPAKKKAAKKAATPTGGPRRIGVPGLIELADIKAELHAHTTASDGELSILELAKAAKARGFHTIAVTDHSKSSPIAGGLTVERLKAHIRAVHEADAQIDGITILAGSEVDILADGHLDYDDELLAQLDIVVASPHTATTQDPETATKRLLKAVRHPLVHILGHPTARLINRRPGMSPDIGEIAAAAKEHGVALEINAHWMRLDLRDQHVRAATDAGCLVAINCDVHAEEDFDNLRYGVLTGRRGWLTKEMCVNAWGAGDLRKWLKRRGNRG
ncbi:MAG: PHP domain-containing protein [Phycisphaerales bacterium]|nr:PHP domain-containing protein [Phycisphaerales bacterium]